MNVLVACEESQAVCKEFRKLGHTAFSADIKECSGDHPEWHIMGDVRLVLRNNIIVETQSGEYVYIDKWDILIAHPPCTYLTNVGNRAFSLRVTDPKSVVKRWDMRVQAAIFFMELMLADIPRIAVENPVGYMNRTYRKPDQVIEPYMFAESYTDSEYVTKKTCLWLKDLPPLIGNGLKRPDNGVIFGKYSNGKNKTWEDCFSRDASVRSKTFHGIAKAMAQQWGGIEEHGEKQKDRQHLAGS